MAKVKLSLQKTFPPNNITTPIIGWGYLTPLILLTQMILLLTWRSFLPTLFLLSTHLQLCYFGVSLFLVTQSTWHCKLVGFSECWFLGAIASPNTYLCQSGSGWVSGSLVSDLEIAIASPSFASLENGKWVDFTYLAFHSWYFGFEWKLFYFNLSITVNIFLRILTISNMYQPLVMGPRMARDVGSLLWQCKLKLVKLVVKGWFTLKLPLL